jgi:hypothetical protein
MSQVSTRHPRQVTKKIRRVSKANQGSAWTWRNPRLRMKDLEDGEDRCPFNLRPTCPLLRGACSVLSEARRNSIHSRRAIPQSSKCGQCRTVLFPYLGTELTLRFHKRQPYWQPPTFSCPARFFSCAPLRRLPPLGPISIQWWNPIERELGLELLHQE